MALSDDTKAQLVALELIRRQLGGLPDEFARVYAEIDAATAAPAPAATQTDRAAGPSKLESLDVNAANAANRATVANWPKVVALVNGLIAQATRRDASLKGAFTTGDIGKAGKRIDKDSLLPRDMQKKLAELRSALGAKPRKKKSAKKPKPGLVKRTAKAVGKGAVSPITGLFTKLIAAVGPLGMLAATINGATSGFQLVTTSMKLLGTTLGAVLMPFMFMLAVGIATVSDILWANLSPNLEGWFTLIIQSGMKAINGMISAAEAFVGAVQWAARLIRGETVTTDEGETTAGDAIMHGMLGWATDYFSPRAPGAPPPDSALRVRRSPRATPDDDASAAYNAAGHVGLAIGDALDGITAGRGFSNTDSRRELIHSNMKDMLKELQMGMGPKAQFQGLAQASRSAQLAALNQSPFEAKMLARMQEVIGTLTRVVDNTTRTPTLLHSRGT